MMPALLPTDSRLTWSGYISLQQTSDWVMPWRLPYSELSLYPDPLMVERASMPAGSRLTFCSDTTELSGLVQQPVENSMIDLCLDGDYYKSCSLTKYEQFSFGVLPSGHKQFELWLPQDSPFRLKSLFISPGADIEKSPIRPRLSWLTYGSSITQCREAASPTQTWPSIVARRYDYALTCLGYGGQCHLDPMVARMMRNLKADLLSLCVGINIYGSNSLNQRTLVSSLIGFAKILRETHSSVPLVVLSPIVSPEREEKVNAVGLTLRDVRDLVQETTDRLREAGDEDITYVSGVDLFGAEHAHLLPDGLHPNTEGYAILADNFSRLVADDVFAGAVRKA